MLRALLLTLLFAVTSAYASSPVTRSWGRVIDLRNSNDDRGVRLKVDANGNTYMAGTTVSGNTMWWYVQKYDPYGSLLWSTPLSLPEGASLDGLCIDSTGSVYLMGYAIYPQSSLDIQIAKLYPNGSPAWQEHRETSSLDVGLAITTDQNGDVIVAAREIIPGAHDMARIVFNSSGQFVQSTQYKTIDPEYAFFTPTGYLYATGGKPGVNGSACCVVNPSGTAVFTESFTDTESDTYEYRLGADKLDNLYIVVNHSNTTNQVVTKSYSMRCYSTNFATNFLLASTPGILSDLAAETPENWYAIVQDTNSSHVVAYSLAKVRWSDNHEADRIATDGLNGVAVQYTYAPQNPAGPASSSIYKLDVMGNLAWQQNYSNPAGATSACDFQMVGGAAYFLGTLGLTTGVDIVMLKYTQGVAIRAMGLDASSVNGGAIFEGSVSINAPAPPGGFAVQMISSIPGALGVNPSIVIPEGATFASFTVRTNVVDQVLSGVVYARAGGVLRFASTLINPAVLTSIGLSKTTVTGGAKVTATVTLSAVTGLAGRNVALSSSDTTAATVPSAVYIAAGAKSATFTVTTKSVVGANKTPSINAKLSGVTKSVTLTVTP